MDARESFKQFELNDSEYNVLQVLSDELEKGNSSITIRELSKKTYTATASIVRLAKKIGYYGYSDMLFSFRKKQSETVEFKTKDTLSSVMVSEESLQVMDRLISDIVSGEYDVIDLDGTGYSAYVAEYMCDKLTELGIPSSHISPMDLKITKNPLVIFISASGETKDVIHLIDECRNAGYKMYAITAKDKSSLSKRIADRIVLFQEAGSSYQNYFVGNAIILMENMAAAIYNLKKQ